MNFRFKYGVDRILDSYDRRGELLIFETRGPVILSAIQRSSLSGTVLYSDPVVAMWKYIREARRVGLLFIVEKGEVHFRHANFITLFASLWEEGDDTGWQDIIDCYCLYGKILEKNRENQLVDKEQEEREDLEEMVELWGNGTYITRDRIEEVYGEFNESIKDFVLTSGQSGGYIVFSGEGIKLVKSE